ncbi:hypothetical protein SAMN04489727_2525 [Amycolatopsis tolypomycina]|uniref:Uncharacterized protein n=1 Tax=Amycolatopsis tolypomycina TaxID=208445 RepID=A0A1H4PPJ5_9PSEU|nr:hypothetical protein [Amycolatopsis tolypomycina]SEC09168.1 hypothetical protein SAMN04489727_2525 [Amycolatopsis tolypomycina]
MADLETRLREVEVPEPPLGFDPDAVADLAARQVRKRRAGVAGIAVVTASVVAAVLFGPGPAPAPPAAPLLPPSPAEQARINRAFTDALERVLPGRRSLTVGQSYSDALIPGRMSTSALFVDAAGRRGSLQLTVRGPGTAQEVMAPDRVCENYPAQYCTQLSLPGGVVVRIPWFGIQNGPEDLARWPGNGYLYRPDGSTVTVLGYSAGALTEDRFVQLITDPAFVLR